MTNVTPSAKGRKTLRDFASWKFDVINALVADDEISAAEQRIAVRILQAVNADTRAAFISDETLVGEGVVANRKTINRARKKLEQLGWWSVRRGGNRRECRASSYTFDDARVRRILARLADRRAALANVKSYGTKRVPDCEPQDASYGTKTVHDDGTKRVRLHLQDTPSYRQPEEQDLGAEGSPHAREDYVDAECCECGQSPAWWAMDGDWYCIRHFPRNTETDASGLACVSIAAE